MFVLVKVVKLDDVDSSWTLCMEDLKNLCVGTCMDMEREDA